MKIDINVILAALVNCLDEEAMSRCLDRIGDLMLLGEVQPRDLEAGYKTARFLHGDGFKGLDER